MNALLEGIGSVLDIAPKTLLGPSPRFDSAEKITQAAWSMIGSDFSQVAGNLVFFVEDKNTAKENFQRGRHFSVSKDRQGQLVVKLGNG